MVKKDPIFWWATGIFFASLLLALLVSTYFIYAIIIAFLLRPTMHSLGLAEKYIDERQKLIQFHSGNIAFVVMVLAVVVLAIRAEMNHETVDELMAILALGLAAKALVGLVMIRDYRSAGVQITITVILILTAYITLESGFSVATLIGTGVAIILSFMAMLGLKFPRVLAAILITMAILISLLITPGIVVSLLLPLPLVVAAVCLILSTNSKFTVDFHQTTSIKTFLKSNIEKLIVFAVLAATGLVLVGQISQKELERNKTAGIAPLKVIEVQEVSCREGVRYHENGKLEYCVLACEDTVFGQSLPLGTSVFFTSEGYLRSCFLPDNMYIDGFLCRGHGHDWSTGFHPNGKLKVAWPAEDQEIQGITCKKATFWTEIFGGSAMTTFHDNGQLKRCLLAKDVTIGDQPYEKGDHINFNRNGTLVVKK